MSSDDSDSWQPIYAELEPISDSDSSFNLDDSNYTSDSVELFNHKVRFEKLFSV